MNKSFKLVQAQGLNGMSLAAEQHVRVLRVLADIDGDTNYYVHGSPKSLGQGDVSSMLRKGKHVGYYVWESTELEESFKVATKTVHEIWTPSEYSAQAFRGLDIPVKVVPHYTESFSKTESENEIPKVLVAFDYHSRSGRKNGIFAAQTLAEAKKQVKFTPVFKVLNSPDFFTAFVKDVLPNVEFSSKPVSDMTGFYKKIDVVYSPHKSEGFGRVLLEGLAHSKKVVATRHGGCLDFLSDSNSWLIDCDVRPVDDSFFAGEWGYPDRKNAVEQLVEAIGERSNTKVLNGFDTALSYNFAATLKATEAALV